MSGSYARGDQPRSVPDSDAEDYDEMIRQQRFLNARQLTAWRPTGSLVVSASQSTTPGGADYWSTHPDLLESLVPVWGSAREAIADAREGDIVGAVGNGVLAVTDLAPGAFAVKGALKGGVKMTGSHSWKQTRKWMGDQGMLSPGQHGHHGIIPKKGWGKAVPDGIKNQPWNITGMKTPEIHGRIHHAYDGKPRFNLLQQYRYGAPNWAKAAHVWIPTGGVTAVDASEERSRQDR